MSNKFGRSSRLTTKADYAKVFNKPKRFSGQYWQILAKDTKQNKPRLGLAISKRILRRAVDRNIYKRIAREVFRLNKGELAVVDFVVMARKIILMRTHRVLLHNELLDLLQQVKK